MQSSFTLPPELEAVLYREVNRPVPTRLILINYWLFTQQIFHFAQGRLFLTGDNGSGKSTVLTAAITLLLDGDHSPARLDPFGASRRSLRYYLLGDAQAGFQYQSRTAYLALEFRQPGGYQTIGLGLSLSEGGEVGKWGFYLPGRVEHPEGLSLLQDDQPLRYRALRERVEKLGGTVVQGQGEYSRLVARYLYGLEDQNQYRELVDLILKLRGSKLGREVRIRDIEEQLRRSLPPISSSTLTQLSEGIAQLDRHAERIRQLEAQAQAAQVIAERNWDWLHKRAMLAYLRSCRAEAQAQEAESQYRSTQTQQGQYLEQLQTIQHALETLQPELEHVRAEVETLEARIRDEQGALKKLEDDLEAARRELKNRQEGLRRQAERLEKNQARYQQLLAQQTEWQTTQSEALSALQALAWWQGEGSLVQRGAALGRADQVLRDYEQKTERLHQDERLTTEAAERAEAARLRLEERTRALEETLAQTQARLLELAREGLGLDDLSAYALALEQPDASQAAQTLWPQVAPRLEAAQATLEERRDHRKALQAQLQTRRDEFLALQSQQEAVPPLPPDRAQASHLLQQAGIAHAPLYALIRPRSESANLGGLEAGLLAAGLLTALVVAPTERGKAQELLHQAGLSDALLRWPMAPAAQAHLGELLEPEDEAPAGLVEWLQQIALEPLVGLASAGEEGFWSNGLLAGTAKPHPGLRFIGSLARQRERERQLNLLREQIEALERSLELVQAQEDQAGAELERLNQIWRRLSEAKEEQRARQEAQHQRALARQDFETRSEEYERQLARLTQARQAFQAAREQLQQEFVTLGLEPSRAGLQQAQAEYQQAQAQERRWQESRGQLQRLAQDLQDNAERNQEIQSEQHRLEEERREYELRRDALSNQLQMLRRDLEAPDAAELRTRFQKSRQRLRELEQTDKELRQKQANLSERLRVINEQLPSLEQRLREAQERQTGAQERLAQTRATHPRLQALDLGSPLSEKELEEESNQAFERLSQQFDQFRHHLEAPDNYQPRFGVNEGVRFNLEGQAALPDELLEHLAGELEAAQRLLSDEEARVFREELVYELVEELDRRLREAQTWVKQTQGILRSLEFHGERLDLEMYRREPSGLAALVDGRIDPAHQPEHWWRGVRQEIRHLIQRLRENPDPERSFNQQLEQALDYREWYGFRFFSEVGQNEARRRRELSDRVFLTRSGGERSAVLYTFLFAALGARFDALGRRVPRLVGIDEAFAGMDAVNIAALYRIMSALELCWIATSERRVDLSTALSAAVTYQLFRVSTEKGDGVSSLAFVWDGTRVREAPVLL